MVKQQYRDVKSAHKTMGVAQLNLHRPENFLKVGDGLRARPTTQKDHNCYRRCMPDIPKPLERRRCQSAPAKNFRQFNIQSIEVTKPKPVTNKCIFTRNGDSEMVILPFHVHQSKFGNLPKYLTYRMEELRAKDEIQRQNEMKRQPLCRFIRQNDRLKMLQVTVQLS